MSDGRSSISALQLVILSAFSDFVIAAGGTITGGTVAGRGAGLPGAEVWILAVVFGLVAAGKEIKQRAIQALEIRVPEIKEPPS